MSLLKWLLWSLVLLLPSPALCGEYQRDFPATPPPAAGVWEVSAVLRGMNDRLDLFGFRDNLCPGCDDGSVGNASGGELLVSYGATSRLGINGVWGRDRLDAGIGSVELDHWQLGAKFHPWPVLLIEAGGRGNVMAPQTVREPQDLSRLLGYIDRHITLRDIGSHLLISNGTTNLYLLKSGEPLYIRHSPAHDWTYFGRVALLTPEAGKWRAGLFAEMGVTRIAGHVDSNYPELVGTALASQSMNFPLGLGRSEHYVKLGGQVTLTAFLGAFWNLSGYYERIERGAGLNYVDYNQVLAGDLVLPVAEGWAVLLGATYYRRQLNGEIPLLYSRYTQTTFDHDYGLARVGLIYSF